MIFRFIYEPDYARIIPAILIDARASIPAIANQAGTVIKAYTDAAVAAVTPETIVYKIERADIAVLCGYFTIITDNMGQTAVFGTVTLRPAFVSSSAEIQQNIAKFVSSLAWRGDILI